MPKKEVIISKFNHRYVGVQNGKRKYFLFRPGDEITVENTDEGFFKRLKSSYHYKNVQLVEVKEEPAKRAEETQPLEEEKEIPILPLEEAQEEETVVDEEKPKKKTRKKRTAKKED